MGRMSICVPNFRIPKKRTPLGKSPRSYESGALGSLPGSQPCPYARLGQCDPLCECSPGKLQLAFNLSHAMCLGVLGDVVVDNLASSHPLSTRFEAQVATRSTEGTSKPRDATSVQTKILCSLAWPSEPCFWLTFFGGQTPSCIKKSLLK